MELQKQGQYPGHPVVLLVYLAGGMLLTMLTMHPVLLGVSMLCATIYAGLLWGGKMWKRLLGLMLPVSLFSMVLLPLFSHRGVTPLFYINGMAVTAESVWYGAAMSFLLLGVFQWFQIANALLDSERLLYLFGRGLPSAGLLISMVFRLIPLFGERFRQIRDAQRGMGRRSEELSLPGRGRLLLREISILISWSLEASMETAVSMESRGYGTGRRSSFSLFRFQRRDGISIVLFVVLYGVCLWQLQRGEYAASYFPMIRVSVLSLSGSAGMWCFALAAMLPVWGGLWERAVQWRSQNRRKGGGL